MMVFLLMVNLKVWESFIKNKALLGLKDILKIINVFKFYQKAVVSFQFK